MSNTDYDDMLYRREEEDARPYLDRPELASSNPEMMFNISAGLGVLEGTHQLLSASEFREREKCNGDGEVPGISFLVKEED